MLRDPVRFRFVIVKSFENECSKGKEPPLQKRICLVLVIGNRSLLRVPRVQYPRIRRKTFCGRWIASRMTRREWLLAVVRVRR